MIPPRGSAQNSARSQPPLAPGGTVGVIGGGQLGRMLAIAAKRMGYRLHVIDPTADCPTAHVADAQVTAKYDDIEALTRFARGVDVVTFEFENIPADALDAIAATTAIRPGPHVLRTCRHRGREKRFLCEHGLPVAPFHVCHRPADVKAGLEKLGTPAILKTAEFGYDGKGQYPIQSSDQWQEAWKALGTDLAILEGFVDFTAELSVVCARGTQGEMRCFDPARNDHVNGILDVSTVPAEVSQATRDRAVALAKRIAEAIDCVGVIAVEMFLVRREGRDELVVNELAPRPHNSGHHTFDACVTSQFEQQLRAICGMPLGDPSLIPPAAAMANLLGDLWFAKGEGDDPTEPNWRKVLAMGDVKLHLYGKRDPRPGRKMGHLLAMGPDPATARGRIRQARAALG